MTYRQLSEKILNNLTEEQQNQDVTVYLNQSNEVFAVTEHFFVGESDLPEKYDDLGDVLDKGHYILGIDY